MDILRCVSQALLLAEIGPQIRFINNFQKNDRFSQLAQLSAVFDISMLKALFYAWCVTGKIIKKKENFHA